MHRLKIATRFGAVALATSVLLACGKKEEPKPTPVSPPAEKDEAPEAAPDPHGPGGPAAEPARATREAKGTFELMVDGTPQPLEFLPFGRNSAVWVPDTKVARINLGASESDKGLPSFSIVLLGHKLDELELPKTISNVTVGRRGGPQEGLRMIWQVGEKRAYRTTDADTAKGLNKVTLESYESGRLKGSFEGTLVFGNAKAEKPLQIKGSFDVALRLNGVEPNRIAAQGG